MLAFAAKYLVAQLVIPGHMSKLEGNGPIDSRAKVMMSDGNFLLWPKKHSIAGSWSCNKSCQKKKCAGGGAVNIPVPNFCQYCTKGLLG